MTTRPRNPQLRLLPLPEDYEPPFDLESGVDDLTSSAEMVAWLRELVRDYFEAEEEWSNDSVDLFLEALGPKFAHRCAFPWCPARTISSTRSITVTS